MAQLNTPILGAALAVQVIRQNIRFELPHWLKLILSIILFTGAWGLRIWIVW